jgi:predicted CXXCH cytochrome family protein
MILASLWVVVVGCDEVERHKTLTFFFDGVPPLGGYVEEEVVVDPNAVDARRRRQRPKEVWFIHDPQDECVTCHGEKTKQRWFSAQVQLVVEVPELCYGCHENFAELEGWVHGPVANGLCLYCHDPHRSRNEHLLRRPVPDICYGCHEAEVIAAMGQHCTEPYLKCNDCHHGHASAEQHLLKDNWKDLIAGEPNSLAGPSGQ